MSNLRDLLHQYKKRPRPSGPDEEGDATSIGRHTTKTRTTPQTATEPQSPEPAKSIEPVVIPVKVKIAIIVPFRDTTKTRERLKQLDIFVPFMCDFLEPTGCEHEIYIVEQSNDSRKFNRGKLLNIGFDLARKDHCEVFVFHDVDLLPSAELLSYYATVPSGSPVHIAKVWARYSAYPDYFGGIAAFSKDMFEAINGFPNNFWGWGGEDDECMLRVKEVGMIPSAPTEGSIRDLENLTMYQKLSYLDQSETLRCHQKFSLLDEHDTWRENGLSSIEYDILETVDLSRDHCKKYTVDIKLNNHWTDKLCRMSSTLDDHEAYIVRNKTKK